MQHKTFFPKQIAIATVSALVSLHAWADDAPQAASEPGGPPAAEQSQSLQTVQVNAANRSTRTENRDTYTTSAMRTTTGLALSPKETPQSVSVITRSMLDRRGITNMEDALRNTTGVNVVVDSGRYRYQSRGYYIDQIEEDGISSTVPGSATNPYADSQSITDMVIYDHVEVVRGATGLTQANGSPGGTINAVRKRPTAERRIGGSFLFDRFGRARTEADVSGSLNSSQSVRGRVITALDRSNSFKKNVDGANGILYGIMEADAGENTKFTLGGLYQRNRDTIDPSGLLMATDNSDLGLPRQTFLGAKWNKAVFSKASLFGEVEHYFNDDWKYTGKISYTRSKSDEAFGTLARRNNGDPSMTARIGILSKYFGHTRQIAINNNLNGKFSAFGRKHDIFLRHSYNREKSISRNIDSVRDTRAAYNIYTFSGNGDIPYPNWGNKAWDGVSQTLFTTNMLTGGIRFNPLENLHILAGGSYTRFKSHYVENAWRSSNPNRPYTENTLTRQNHFTPYFGITFDITPHHSLYAGYTSIFKPSYGRKDREGKQIKPKTGNNLEIGWKGAWRNNKLNASVALFQLDEKNRPYAITKTMNPTIERTYYSESK